jgi:hypothetical protein
MVCIVLIIFRIAVLWSLLLSSSSILLLDGRYYCYQKKEAVVAVAVQATKDGEEKAGGEEESATNDADKGQKTASDNADAVQAEQVSHKCFICIALIILRIAV